MPTFSIYEKIGMEAAVMPDFWFERGNCFNDYKQWMMQETLIVLEQPLLFVRAVAITYW